MDLALEHEQRSEVFLAEPVADQALHELVHRRCDRERDLVLPRCGQSEVEVLAQQRRR